MFHLKSIHAFLQHHVLRKGKVLITVSVFLLSATTSNANVVTDSLLHRILPYGDDAQRFECITETDQTKTGDWFTVRCDGSKITVKGPNNVSLATGINWYLNKAGIDISWNAPTATLPATLPKVDSETHRSKVDYRYYLNFCTHSYTMAFWDWNRWQQEIDWMALHGINLPLITEGMECVWRKVLTDAYGYDSLDKVNKFVTGAAYYGWFFMNNMTEWGGPQPESWYTQQEALAKRIFRRLKDYGITPVIPGYVGMVPKDFLTDAASSKISGWKSGNIVSSGEWNQFVRPYFVNDTTRLKEFAANYYKAINDIYGDVLSTHYYAIDPFHEGGVPNGVNAANSIKAMWNALKSFDGQAIWVAQHWQSNPTNNLTHNVPNGRLLILDLHGDSGGETELSGSNADAQGNKHQWVWGMTNNFGGNVGLFGRMNQIMTSFYAAAKNQQTNNLRGIGAIPEGIENNNILFDLLYAMPWTCDNPYTIDSWINHYVTLRYGVTATSDSATYKTLVSAWTRLANGIYNCPNSGQQGTTESVFMMRPASAPGSVSTWAGSSWYWDIDDLRTAAKEFLSVADKLQSNDNYRYDLVDVMRQALADHGKEILDSLSMTYDEADRARLEQKFLGMILDQDTLVGTRKELRLGTWTEMARSRGNNDSEKTLYEKNARMLLTTWGGEQQCNGGGLHDYANREWNGLLSAYYYPRWKAYFDNASQAQNWFADYEWPFATGTRGKANISCLPAGAPYDYGAFSGTAVGDEITQAKAVYNKYFKDFKPSVWEPADIDTSRVYVLTNAEAWYNNSATHSEGLCLVAPNNDYNQGYRLGRKQLGVSDKSFYWRFRATDQPHVYRLYSVMADSLKQYGAYVSSTPSSTAYPSFTLNSTGDTYTVYRKDNTYYLQDAVSGKYMSPDTRFSDACVLVSDSRPATAVLYLDNPYTSVFNDQTDTTAVYQLIFKRGGALVGNYGAFADAEGNVSSDAASRKVSTTIVADNTTSPLTTTLWKIVPDGWNTYLQNAQTGFWVGNVDNGNLVTTAQKEWGRAYRINGNGKGQWVAYDPKVSGNNYLNSFYGDTNTGARNIGYWKDGFADAGNVFVIRKVSAVSVNTSNGWATCALPVAVSVPGGVRAFVARSVDGTAVTMLALRAGDVIAPGEGFVLHADAASVSLPVTGVTAPARSNVLTGVTTTRRNVTTEGVYLLDAGQSMPVWRRQTSTTTLPANTAVIIYAGGGDTLSFDTPSGIRNFSADTQSAAAYSITGMRVTKSYKGIVLKRMGKNWVKAMTDAK